MKEIRPLSFLGGRVTAHMRRNIATALLLSIAAIAADASPLDPCGPPDLSCFVNDPDFSVGEKEGMVEKEKDINNSSCPPPI